MRDVMGIPWFLLLLLQDILGIHSVPGTLKFYPVVRVSPGGTERHSGVYLRTSYQLDTSHSVE